MKKFLIADDDAGLCQMYAEVFSAKGYVVVKCSDGMDALDKLLEGGFVATLLDLHMPLKDGVEVLKTLSKKDTKEPNGPIYVLTNDGHEFIKQTALKNGADGFFDKNSCLPHEILKEIEAKIR